MAESSFSRVYVKNFGCLKDVAFDLTPLHAIIGPNDSGKSTFLRLMEIIAQPGVPIRGPVTERLGIHPGQLTVVEASRLGRHATSVPLSPNDAFNWKDWTMLGSVNPRILRLDPDEMRKPWHLLPVDQPLWFHNERGQGLSSLYDAIFSRDPEQFLEVQAAVRTHFPHVKSISLRNVNPSQKEIGVTLVDGTSVGAANLSEGMLYFLAFAALKQLPGEQLFLIEEPENGLHPARIAVVMDLLRDLSKTSQVILATHSPLVVNCLTGDEITVVTRDKVTGTRAERLSSMPRFKEADKVFLPGEYWVNYCDGDEEAPLREVAAPEAP
jgi:predicted ATPase